MKKHKPLFVLILVLFTAVPAGAQHGVGLCAGMNLVKVSVDPGQDVNYSFRPGFAVGRVLDIQLSRKTLLHLEPAYLQKGGKAKFDGF